jgi:hypothetical protein
VGLVIVIKLSTTLLKMLNPVEICILNLWRKALLHLTALYISRKNPRGAQATDVLLERVGHELYTAIGYCLMRLLLVYPECLIVASFLVKKEVAKRRMQ